MGRKAKDLTALTISKLKKPGLNFVGHVSGLALHVSATGARSWILRVMSAGKRRDIGLGPFPDVSLVEVRDKAYTLKSQIREGLDPLAERRSVKSALRKAQASLMTFAEAAEKYITAHQTGWRNSKHTEQWRSTLRTYAYSPSLLKDCLGEFQL